MPMIPFIERFRDLGTKETRTLLVKPEPGIPGGAFGLFELYCDEPGCDCRRVIISVLKPETGWRKVWATIGYGWESADFYLKWSRGHSDPFEMQGPALDELNPQSEYSEMLLELFKQVLESPGYVERLKRHYQMFRGTVEAGPRRLDNVEANRIENKRKRLRDPKRRSRH